MRHELTESSKQCMVKIREDESNTVILKACAFMKICPLPCFVQRSMKRSGILSAMERTIRKQSWTKADLSIVTLIK